MMKVDLGKVSHRGMVRLSNEDSLLTLELLTNDSESRFFGLYAVADGVGGHEAGEIASSLALRVLTENIVKPLLLPELEGKPSVLSDESILKVLTQAVTVANSEVYNQGQVKGTDM
jgi:protein phosphatase